MAIGFTKKPVFKFLSKHRPIGYSNVLQLGLRLIGLGLQVQVRACAKLCITRIITPLKSDVVDVRFPSTIVIILFHSKNIPICDTMI